MNNLIETLFNDLEEKSGKDTYEYRIISGRCSMLYDELLSLIDGDNKNKMVDFENQYSNLECLSRREGFIEGFKTALKVIFQSLA